MRVSLNGNDWMYKDFIGDDWVWRHSEKPNTRDIRWWRKGLVPGSVTDDLWTNNEIPDPYYEKNSLLIEWIPERTWIYKKMFTLPEEMRELRVRLVFEGVDYESKFFFNGSFLGSHLRVWGGGLKEKKGFYDLCDQFGIKQYKFKNKDYV